MHSGYLRQHLPESCPFSSNGARTVWIPVQRSGQPGGLCLCLILSDVTLSAQLKPQSLLLYDQLQDRC